LVHGGWGGGWHGDKVAPLLRAAGHDVYTPTLTGLGERAHLARPEIDLTTRILDVVGVLEFEDLRDAVLIGHSCGGMPATGAADRAPERLAHLVYLDAYAPRDGQSMLDLMEPNRRAATLEQVRTTGEGWRIPPPLAGDPRTRVAQPFRTYEPPIHLTNMAAAAVPHTYIRCTIDLITGRGEGPMVAGFAPHAERARAEGWGYRELEAAHDCIRAAPRAVADLLLEVVSGE
jgi:pimeloyl-ACP methyl ester carboxylesterase